MSREATKYSYGKEITDLELRASDLAFLRALCWRTDPKIGRTQALSDAELTYLTGYRGRQTFTNARKRLRQLGIISYEHENLACDQNHPKFGTSNGYVYKVHYEKPVTPARKTPPENA